MQKIVAFLKSTFLGGALIVLPAWLAVLLFLKALVHLEVIVKPVSKQLPESIGHPLYVAIGLMIALCFIVGALIRTTIGRQVEKALEDTVLTKVPGYTVLRNVAAQIGDLEENHGFKPALIEIEDALAPRLHRRGTRWRKMHRLCSVISDTDGRNHLHHRPGQSASAGCAGHNHVQVHHKMGRWSGRVACRHAATEFEESLTTRSDETVLPKKRVRARRYDLP